MAKGLLIAGLLERWGELNSVREILIDSFLQNISNPLKTLKKSICDLLVFQFDGGKHKSTCDPTCLVQKWKVLPWHYRFLSVAIHPKKIHLITVLKHFCHIRDLSKFKDDQGFCLFVCCLLFLFFFAKCRFCALLEFTGHIKVSQCDRWMDVQFQTCHHAATSCCGWDTWTAPRRLLSGLVTVENEPFQQALSVALTAPLSTVMIVDLQGSDFLMKIYWLMQNSGVKIRKKKKHHLQIFLPALSKRYCRDVAITSAGCL